MGGRKDAEARSAYNHDYWEKNRNRLLPKARERARLWQQQPTNRKRHTLMDRKRRRAHPGENSEANHRSRLKVKLEGIKHYGGKCACCGETEPEFLVLDHVNGGGGKERRENKKLSGGGGPWRYTRDLGYPPDFQVLCHNCNWSKHMGKGICIHKRKNAS